MADLRALTGRSTPVFWFLLGIVLLLISVVVAYNIEVPSGQPRHYILESIAETIKAAGAAVIIIGGINALIETKHWTTYFEERIKDIVIEQKYLDRLDETTLTTLHTKLMQAQFRNSTIGGEESFFAFYNKHIHGFIGAPYRQDASSQIKIVELEGEEPWRVDDLLEFTCRKNGGKIQEAIVWEPDESQILESISISVRRPEDTEDTEICSRTAEGKSLTKDALTDLKAGIPLNSAVLRGNRVDLTDCDCLKISVRSKYRMKPGALTWSFALPTKRLNLSARCNPKYELIPELFIANQGSATIRRDDGYLSIAYSEWILPQNGIVIRVQPRLPQRIVAESKVK